MFLLNWIGPILDPKIMNEDSMETFSTVSLKLENHYLWE